MLREAQDRIQFLERLNEKVEQERRQIEQILKKNLVPQFAGFLEDKMMKKLREDNQQLSSTHHAANYKVEDLEARLNAAQEKMLQKLRSYETRIAELEAELKRARHPAFPPKPVSV